MRKTLDQIGCEQGTDRCSTGLHDYLVTYEKDLDGLRDKPIRILEMGVLGLAGIRMWSEYFTNKATEIWGIDIQDYGGKKPDDDRVMIRYGSQSDEVFLNTLPSTFDVIIDDAGHFAKDQIESFRLLWPKVSRGGFYYIEDLHTTHSYQHSNGAQRIMAFIGDILEDMQDRGGPTGKGKGIPTDKWYSIDEVSIRKGLALFKKKK
jgi:hypothetical protein